MNIRDFLERISEMGPIAVFHDTPSGGGNAGGGSPKNLSKYEDNKETLEFFFDDSDRIYINKAYIQSITSDDISITVKCKDGSTYVFEAD